MKGRMKDVYCCWHSNGGHRYFERTKDSAVDTSTAVVERPSRVVYICVHQPLR